MLDDDGVLLIKNFINEKDLTALNAELDEVFSQISINGGSYSNNTGQRGALECSTPALLMSVNIFEIIIDVVELLKKNSKKFISEDFVLNTLEIQSHKNMKINSWHTDKRGYLSAIIYLKGGGEKSGMFSYMKGTNKTNPFLNKQNLKPEFEKPLGKYHYRLSQEEINEFRDKIVECSAPEGSLVMFDDGGCHEKKPCVEERRAIWIRFSPRKDQQSIARILLSSNHLTEKVMRNINLFSNLEFHAKNVGLHNRERALLNPKPLPLKYYFTGFHKSIIHSTVEGFKNLTNPYPRLGRLLFNLQLFLKKFVAR